MRGARAALLALVAPLFFPSPASAAPERQVLLLIAHREHEAGCSPRVAWSSYCFLPELDSYEDVLARPTLAALARAGGVGLMTTRGGQEAAAQAGVTLGAGATAEDRPPGPFPFVDRDTEAEVDVTVLRGSAGEARPGLLGTTLAQAGKRVGYLYRKRAPGEFVAMDTGGRIPIAIAAGPSGPETEDAIRQFELLLQEADVVVADVARDEDVLRLVDATSAPEVLVVFVVPYASRVMRERGDLVTPLVMARGAPGDLLEFDHEGSGLTSDTTRREGVVANVDVAPTMLEFLGVAIPAEMTGSPIRTEGEPPRELHQRYLEWRRSATPAGLVVLTFALTSLAVGLGLLAGPWRAPRWVTGAVSIWALSSVALLAAMIPASLTSDLRLPAVLAAMAGIGAVLTASSLALGERSAVRTVALVAGAGLGFVVLDGLLGWATGLTPLLGGSALEGVRFFGLGNPSAGIVVSGAVLAAALLRPWAGVGLLVGGALFAGLPFLGADLGGGVTLFAVAAIWYALRVHGRFRWRELLLVAAVAVAGFALLVVGHQVLPSAATHVSRAVEGAGPGDLLDLALRRLALNLEATSSVPASWLAVLGLPVWFLLAWRRPGRFRLPLDGEPAWRHAVMALAAGGMIGYLVNDTYSMAAVTFVFVSGAMVVPALRWTSS